MPKFTRKHYQTIADILRQIQSDTYRWKLIDLFIETFTADNPRFDAKRFRLACTLPYEISVLRARIDRSVE